MTARGVGRNDKGMADELIEVEFIKDTAKRHAGELLRVDADSAAAMIERGDARATGVRTPAPPGRAPVAGWITVDLVHEGGGKVGDLRWRTDTDLIRVGDVLILPRVDASMPGTGGQPALSLRVEVRQGVPMFTRVEFESGQDGRAVTGQDLNIARKMMAYWLDDIVELVSQEREPDPARKRTGLGDGERKRRAMTPEFLADVAHLYRANVDGQPVEAIRRVYATSYRSAARWVDLCRSDEYQLLPKTTPGKRKA